MKCRYSVSFLTFTIKFGLTRSTPKQGDRWKDRPCLGFELHVQLIILYFINKCRGIYIVYSKACVVWGISHKLKDIEQGHKAAQRGGF